jgi:poly(A) polymerase
LPLIDIVLEQPLGQRFVELALADTDLRVREDRGVSPAFLFATLLWHEVLAMWTAAKTAGEKPIPALFVAMDEVLRKQAKKIAVPRRFEAAIKEIWSLQPRFEQIQRKRVFRLMTHPRFRAAFDFLLLRADESPAMRELGQWWAHAQQLPQDVLAAALPAGGGSSASDHVVAAPVAGKPPRPRRRRRKPGGKSGSV